MMTITKRNVFFVLVASLALAVSVGGIGPSPAFGWEDPEVPEYAEGWMTGGGSIFPYSYGGNVSNGRVTHGFVVHCTPRHSDNLEIVNHADGLNFQLTELSYARCTDDPNIEPNPPDAAFDTFEGVGFGRCRGGEAGRHWVPCTVWFKFTDGGERGGCIRDEASIEIAFDGDFFLIGGSVDCGNHQAHGGVLID